MGRPLRDFAGFVGQATIVGSLKRLADGAKSHGLPVPWQLFQGPAGYGKTSLARSLARHYGSEFHLLLGSRLAPEALAATLTRLNDCDIVLVDEAHALPHATQTALLLASDEQKVPALDDKRQQVLLSIAPLTVILATNRAGMVSEALRSRCDPVTFADYGEAELIEIARRVGDSMGLGLTGQAARRIAQQAHGRPRGVVRRLERVRLLLGIGVTSISINEVEDALRSEGIDEHGLDRSQRTYLDLLSVHGRMSIERLALLSFIDEDMLRTDVEPPLIRAGFIDCGPGGRRLVRDPRKPSASPSLEQP